MMAILYLTSTTRASSGPSSNFEREREIGNSVQRISEASPHFFGLGRHLSKRTVPLLVFAFSATKEKRAFTGASVVLVFRKPRQQMRNEG
jgi:hypothetical protein